MVKNTESITGVKKKISRKNAAYITISVSILLILIFLLSPFIKQCYYRFLYFGDRITVTFDLTVDGEELSFEQTYIDCIHSDRKQDVKADDTTFSVRANDYGLYSFNLDCNDFTITLDTYQANWWSVQKLNISASVDTQSNELWYGVKCEYVNNDASKSFYMDESTVSLENGAYNITATII